MKKLLFTILTVFSTACLAKETVTVYFNANATQPNLPAYIRMLEIANQQQSKYNFVLELKPGANGTLALKAMDQRPESSLATTAPAFVENARSGLINEADYVPVAAQGDACWAVISTLGNSQQGVASLRGQGELVIGTTGYGNVTHLTALILAERYGLSVRFIPFKANFDALVNMTGNQGVNFTIERVANYQTMVTKNPRLQILGMACDSRNPAMPRVKTLAEQGITAPTIFLTTLANIRMPQSKRQELSAILHQAQAKLGNQFLLETADLSAPQFQKPPVSVEQFFNQRVLQIRAYLAKYDRQIQNSKK